MRYDRNIKLFGQEGQRVLQRLKVVIVGVGGIGMHVVQQLVYLGVGNIALIDSENLDETNLNRYVGARPSDVGIPKVIIGQRIINQLSPDTAVQTVHDTLVSQSAFTRIKDSDYVFGCLDSDGARLILNELCLAYELPYFDLATEIDPGPPIVFGGRVCFVFNGSGCLYCMDIMDITEATKELQEPNTRKDQQILYGIDQNSLGGAGPAVVSINGLIASLAVTEFMTSATGLQSAHNLRNYRGNDSLITRGEVKNVTDCYYCNNVKGQGDNADLEHYIREGVGNWLR